MDINTVRQRLYDYVRVAEEKKLKAIYTIIEGDIDATINPFEDKNFMAELDKRSREMKSGKVKTYTLEETKNLARKKIQAKKVA
jgi:hypothetical protein